MDVRVYRRRGGLASFVAGFFVVWGSGALAAGVTALLQGHLTVNRRDQTVAEAAGFLTLFGVLGTLALTVALGIFLHARNERIELVGTELRWFDFLGRIKGTADLAEVRTAREIADWLGGDPPDVEVETTQGSFRLSRAYFGFFDLRTRLWYAVRGEFFSSERTLQNAAFARIPEVSPKTYRYRYSLLHVASLLPVMLGLFLLLAALRAHGANVVPPLLFGPLFLSVGIYGQLIGWNERIEVRDADMEWFDYRNRSRLCVPFRDLLGQVETPGNLGILRIETTEGIFRVSQYLWGYRDLRRQLGSVFQTPRTA